MLSFVLCMRIYIYIYMYVCTYVRMYVCTYVRTYVCSMYVCTYVRTYVCTYVRTYVRTYVVCMYSVCLCVCVCARVCVCVCVCARVPLFVHVLEVAACNLGAGLRFSCMEQLSVLGFPSTIQASLYKRCVMRSRPTVLADSARLYA